VETALGLFVHALFASDSGYEYSWDESLKKTKKTQIVFRTDFEAPGNLLLVGSDG
jgi:hypothetical protein